MAVNIYEMVTQRILAQLEQYSSLSQISVEPSANIIKG